MNASLPTPSASYQPRAGRNPWRERIGLYALGLCIGLLVLGTIKYGRRNAIQRAQQQLQQIQKQEDQQAAPPAPGVDNEPPAK